MTCDKHRGYTSDPCFFRQELSMADLLYFNKQDKSIDKDEWSNLIRDPSYTNEGYYSKHDLELNLSWIGVCWDEEKNPKTWCLSLETVDELGYVQSIRNFVNGKDKAVSEFIRVKKMMDDGSIFQVGFKKEREKKKRKNNEKK
jgi:hypothetical protein